MKRRARAIATTIAPVRRLMLLAVVIAFSLQAYAVQTHLHGQPLQSAAAQLHQQGSVPAKPLPNDPLDPATCKLCQELIHSGATITPAGPQMVLLVGWVRAAFPPARTAAT